MTRRAQLFVATHAGALARAGALEAGDPPQSETTSCELPDLSPLDLELLGEAAAAAVRFGHGDLEPAEIDLNHEWLFRLPPFLVEVLAEVGRTDDPELPGEVAAAWATSAERDPQDGDPLATLNEIVRVATAAEDLGRGAYLWVRPV